MNVAKQKIKPLQTYTKWVQMYQCIMV